jgi:5-hydroxyisourate hydrolase-like protein (transthyretin family)
MNRRIIFFFLALIAVAISVLVFYPTDKGELLLPDENGGNVESKLADAESEGPGDTAVEDGVVEADGSGDGREAIAEAEATGNGEIEPALEEPWAELVIHLFGENDQVLEGAIAGILQMPEPGSDFSYLQPLFFTMQGRAPASFAVNEVKTDEDGKAVLPLPKNKHGWAIYGRADDRLVGFKIVQGVEKDESRDVGILVLRRGGSLRVEVEDESGKPVALANVVLVNKDDSDPTEMPIHFLRTNNDGVAEFRSLSFHEYEMDVAKPGFEFIDKKDVAITDRGEGLERVVLQGGGSIRGSIVDHLDQPMAGLQISIRAENHRHRPQGLTEDLMSDQAWAVSDESGQFEGYGLVADATYSLSASPSDEITVRSGGHKVGDNVELKVNPMVPFRGRVVLASGAPAVGASVSLQSAASSQHIAPVAMKTNDDGVFEGDVFRGNYRLLIHHEKGEYIHPEVLRLNRKWQMPEIQLADGGSIKITFVKPDGSSVEQIYLSEIKLLAHADADKATRQLLGRLHRMRRKDIVQNNGTCRIDGLNPGKVRLRFHCPGYLEPWLDVDVDPGKLVEREFTVEEGCDLRLTITGPDGFNPRKLVYVLNYADPVSPRHQHLKRSIRFLVDKNGTVNRQALIPGTWTVSVGDDVNPNLGATPGAQLGSFVVIPGGQSQSFEIR